MLSNSLDAVAGLPIAGSAHLIQIALTPVFLLTAIAGFLNVFTGRLARVADRVNAITRARLLGNEVPEARNLTSLARRTLALQAAVALAGASGAFTCAATFTIFVGALGADLVSMLLFWEFGLALLCLLGAISCFVVEMLVSSRVMLAQIRRDR